MTGVVLDASIALTWCFIDEQTEQTNQILIDIQHDGAYVPGLWKLEVGNILVTAERKGRISYADINKFLSLIEQLNIKVDNEASIRGFHEILSIAYTQKLTTYDATYLELAMRMGLPLASKDKHLCEVAKKLGAKILPSY